MWYQFFKYTLFAPGTRLVCRPWVVGEENIPTDGGAILASNHLGVLDPLIVASMIDRPITYPAKKELFDPSGGPGKRIVAWFM
ncbi:MAG: 1-acyl-sn-glycerol-3-phosphate acyltransferase, partial [Cutibacterium granulosum]|nr:1-acyl-sn-glycerol-3-phosphate acyltransferase [Cutibacterium granulosum]